ncbi:MAG: cation:proton antiporter [Candidatus Omnitrophica bacterium]|nr:cation:proton antiporter [Candidatus Omnitrophota bacterium]
MDPTLLFLLAALVIMLLARPLAKLLQLPTLSIYVLSGLILGPSGANLIRETEPLRYLYHLGLILLMFSMGLKIKKPQIQKNQHAVFNIFLFNGLATGIVMGLFLFLFPAQPGTTIGMVFLFGAIFTSSSLEVVVPFLHEFSYRSSRHVRTFVSGLAGGTLLAEIVCLFLVSLFIFYVKKPDIILFLTMGIGITAFIFLVLYGLPFFARKAVSHPGVRKISVEDQSRILIAAILAIVWLAAGLKVQVIIAAFLSGIALANLRIDRRVIQNIDFLSSGIFVPIFFLMAGVETDLRIFQHGFNWAYFTGMLLLLLAVKTISGYLIARREKFGARESFGFGFATTPHLSSTLATAIIGYEAGLLTPVLLGYIILISILTTFLGPIASRLFLFPGSRHREDYRDLEEYLNLDFQPLKIDEPLFSIMTHIRGLEISVYPVVDKKGIYRGVLRLSELRDLILSEELDHLVIAADLLSADIPVLYRDEPVEKAIEVFRGCGCYAFPVLEATDEGDIYVGLILLKDILPDLPVRSNT